MATNTIDILLTNATVVTMNPERDIILQGGVAITGDSIVAVGHTNDLTKKYTATKIIDCTGCIVSPGLINAHTHVPMTLLRGLADDLRLDVWLYGFMMPVEREFVNPEFCYTGTLLACAEMIRSGITTFCDMYYFEDEIATAAAKAGMRAICAQTILKFPAPDASNYDDSLNYCRRFIKKWKGHPLIVPAIGPHAPYTATPDMLRACAEIAVEYDIPLHIHVAETTFEQEGSENEYGQRVVPWLESHNIFKAKVIAAHCVHLDDKEMDTLRKAKTGAVHCPSSNLKLASGVAPIHKMLKNGLNVGLGTDGPASNNDLNMIEEVRLAAFLQKGIFGDPTLLPAAQAWELATIGGARAVHLAHLTGSLEVGKKADIIVIGTNFSHQTPRFSYDPNTIYSQLVYAASATDVRDVLINGQILMEDRQLRTLTEETLHQKAIIIAQKIDNFLANREGDLLSKLLAIGSGVIPLETFEVQAKIKIDNLAELEAQFIQNSFVVERSSIRNQFDLYFLFDQPDLGRIRYREDEVLDSKGNIKEFLYRISLIGPAVERVFDNATLLTRSRYSVPADKSARFYREYFQPSNEIRVGKKRKRYHITYKNTQFAVNLDTLGHNQETYLEIKSRTWSAKDAEEKAKIIGDFFKHLGLTPPDKPVFEEYINLV